MPALAMRYLPNNIRSVYAGFTDLIDPVQIRILLPIQGTITIGVVIEFSP
jgi:hypothetical protein